MSTTLAVNPAAIHDTDAPLQGSRGRRAGPVTTALAPLASLVLPGVGLAMTGSVRRGALVFTGFALSALVPVTVVAVTGMFAFWLMGLNGLYEHS